MQDVVWICTYCSNQQTEGRVEGMKLFKRYVDGFICTVRGDPDEYLIFAISIHKNLQCILKNVKTEENLAFLDLNVNMSSEESFSWVSKTN